MKIALLVVRNKLNGRVLSAQCYCKNVTEFTARTPVVGRERKYSIDIANIRIITYQLSIAELSVHPKCAKYDSLITLARVATFRYIVCCVRI